MLISPSAGFYLPSTPISLGNGFPLCLILSNGYRSNHIFTRSPNLICRNEARDWLLPMAELIQIKSQVFRVGTGKWSPRKLWALKRNDANCRSWTEAIFWHEVLEIEKTMTGVGDGREKNETNMHSESEFRYESNLWIPYSFWISNSPCHPAESLYSGGVG